MTLACDLQEPRKQRWGRQQAVVSLQRDRIAFFVAPMLGPMPVCVHNTRFYQRFMAGIRRATVWVIWPCSPLALQYAAWDLGRVDNFFAI